MSNVGEQVVKKSQKLVNVVCERLLTRFAKSIASLPAFNTHYFALHFTFHVLVFITVAVSYHKFETVACYFNRCHTQKKIDQ